MKITKLGHCCLIIEVDGIRILTDPGMFSTKQDEVTDIDVILITHEHQDHLHIDSLKAVLQHNPKARIITNRGVGKLLEKEGIACELLENGQHVTISGVLLEGLGEKHATIYQDYGQVINTGYFIASRFFYPGDAFTDPQRAVEILALPVAGPWMKISEAIEYAKLIKPRVTFPVHDGILTYTKPFYAPLEKFLVSEGINVTIVATGETKEF